MAPILARRDEVPDAIPLRPLTADAWAPFGTILEIAAPDPERARAGENEFRVVDQSQNGDGWRLAVQIVRQRALRQIGHHPNSKETFEPVTGVAVICVAAPDAPERLSAFVLDRPVVVNASVWHGLIALSAEAVVKIAENREMTGVNRPLEQPLTVGLLPG
jgi:ureidoglycolate hydrolase